MGWKGNSELEQKRRMIEQRIRYYRNYKRASALIGVILGAFFGLLAPLFAPITLDTLGTFYARDFWALGTGLLALFLLAAVLYDRKEESLLRGPT